MDHTYDVFDDIEPVLESESLTKEDEVLAYKLSALDYLAQGNIEQAEEIFADFMEESEEENG